MSPERRRRAVCIQQERFEVSERKAFRVVGQSRAVQRYVTTVRADGDALTQAIVALAAEYGRYGYRRITALLQASGWQVGRDRVQRTWRREGLKVPKKQRPRGRLRFNDGSCVRLRPEYPHHVWSYDFVHHTTEDGRSLRLMTLVDEFSRQCLAIKLDTAENEAATVEKHHGRHRTRPALRAVNAHRHTYQGTRHIAHSDGIFDGTNRWQWYALTCGHHSALHAFPCLCRRTGKRRRRPHGPLSRHDGRQFRIQS